MDAGPDRGFASGTRRRGPVGWVGVALALGAATAAAADTGVLRNWFNDPFFQVRDGMAKCPVPLGPLTDEARMKQDTHPRSERGTRCWQEGRCSRANSYMYDADIAAAVKARFAAYRGLRTASLWVTAQRRFIWIEGCVAPGYRNGTLERLVKDVPDVEMVIVNVARGPHAKPPYRTLEAARQAPARP